MKKAAAGLWRVNVFCEMPGGRGLIFRHQDNNPNHPSEDSLTRTDVWSVYNPASSIVEPMACSGSHVCARFSSGTDGAVAITEVTCPEGFRA